MLSHPLPAARFCLLALLLTGCAHRGIRPPAATTVRSRTPAAITKQTYTGVFGGAKQTFVLYSNGTFKQQFQPRTNKSVTSTGTWSISHLGYGGLDFDHICLPLDSSGEPRKQAKLRLTNFHGASITYDKAFIYFTHLDDDVDENNLVGIKLPGF